MKEIKPRSNLLLTFHFFENLSYLLTRHKKSFVILGLTNSADSIDAIVSSFTLTVATLIFQLLSVLQTFQSFHLCVFILHC